MLINELDELLEYLGSQSEEGVELDKLSNEQIETIQKALLCVGFEPGPIDGLYGKRTNAAWIEYKEREHMEGETVGTGSLRVLRERVKRVTEVVEREVGERREEVIEEIVRESKEIGLGSVSQIGYILATVEHETNGTFKPVREAYWLSEEWRARNLRYAPYYGRGYVQITWRTNYEKYSKLTGVDLVKEPDLAMEPRIAMYILLHGCKTGSFTGRKIEDYIKEGYVDFYNARRVINGLDRAEHIANLAKKWVQQLR
jgi:peptidoglycan hydrolase-like protein with peptidoglycan-binding domain